ncbi:hypothetical protein OVA14_12215 [Agrococcus sp. SL85]|uniref:hypothetical protein n=1 Tax=Agrococcus sp. SL85 TaxID=2995141 RepID=UPI00226CF126|nr:hypothetical protein [Agrococcus sp. SL85]WAC66041.1 hypothetical protein OVA14_12215 [Agrococcus sp. SL85]
MTIRPAEWDVLHPLDGHRIAIVRLVALGPRREPYYRAVTPEADRAERRLIGYWASVDHAHDGVLALYERASGRSTSGGGRAPARPLVPQKPPPCAGPAVAQRPTGAAPPEQRHGYAARPLRHAARA